jgi:hypothetical protein
MAGIKGTVGDSDIRGNRKRFIRLRRLPRGAVLCCAFLRARLRASSAGFSLAEPYFSRISFRMIELFSARDIIL